MISNTVALAFVVGLIGFVAYQRLKPFPENVKGLPLPPGPKPLPLIGNFFDIPAKFQWLTFAKISEQYGDISHVEIMGNHLILLNSLKAVKDLLDKRSSNYSDRARMPMLKELANWGEWALGFMEYGPHWRAHRKMMHTQFNASIAHRYRPTQTAEAARMIRRMLDKPDLFRAHIRHYVTSVVMSITYGIPLPKPGDRFLVIAEKVSKHLEAGTPGRFLVDNIPILKYVPAWFPGGGFQKIAKQWTDEGNDLINVPFDAVKRAIEDPNGTVLPSLVSGLIESFKKNGTTPAEEKIARQAAASAYSAGSDTTAAVMSTLILGIAMYPEVQAKAHAELDAVVGRERLPEFPDRPNLPYLEACIYEALRWQPVAPLSNPHTLTEADEYEGYFLPKGALCMPNSWAILHDEKNYPNPHVFNPDRFLKDGQINPNVLDPAEAAYGYGRRICPGRYVADNSLFITSALVLSCLKFENALDENGQQIPIKPDVGPYLISHPDPFKCTIKPRFPAAPELIERLLEESDHLFSVQQ